ncbi:single-stranded DNA-binding protein [Vibrio barjaei]|uniref:single-stranded DNA-binding protein n=1 Tax=Vibrio barjaei TaxID=1676683 RepID=UPI00228403BB|nr:single-stranded DNA-binding protein [Vibrio barjaei]MCY9872361.1 single-stranded DNA-binding protein [Vibrio barjaei]
MSSVNETTLIGNLGADPEIINGKNGVIARIVIATSETWRDRTTGEQRERTEWHRVTVFGKLAEIVQQYYQKGMLVYCKCSGHNTKWQDSEGKDQYGYELQVQGFNSTLRILNDRRGSSGQAQAEGAPQQSGQKSANQEGKPSSKSFTPPGDDKDNDIPF